MANFNTIITGINAAHNLKNLQDQLKSIQNSNLTQEEKDKAQKDFNKIMKYAIFSTISYLLFMGITCGLIAIIAAGDTKAIVISCTIAVIIETITFVISLFYIRKKLFSEWQKYSEIVNNGWDGLTKEEIDLLKPQDNEEKIIKYYKKKSLKYGFFFLLILIIEIILIIFLDLSIYSPLSLLILISTTIVWYIKEDTCQVNINRIKSGYYKGTFGHYCNKCKTEIKIKFEEIEQYESLPKNKDGYRIMICPNCGNEVIFYSFDTAQEDYKTYLEMMK